MTKADGGSVTKAELVEQVHEAIGPGVSRRDCSAIVNAFLNAVKRAIVDGNRIEIRRFGTFQVRARRARVARNPRTGEAVMVAPRSVPVFKPSTILRDDVARCQARRDEGLSDVPAAPDSSAGRLSETPSPPGDLPFRRRFGRWR